jgi:hypothetical protein
LAAVRIVPRGTAWAPAIADALRDLQTPLVVVASDRVDLVREGWLWEAVKLLELHPDVAAVSGRIVDAGGRIVAGGEVPHPRTGAVLTPLAGLTLADPGPYAFALKPQLVGRVTAELFVGDRVAVLRGLEAGAVDGLSLAARLADDGRRVAYTPLLEGRIGQAGPPTGGTGAPDHVLGLAGFEAGRREFSS